MRAIGPRWLRWTVGVLVVLALVAYAVVQMLYPKHKSVEKVRAEMQAQAALTGPAKLYAATCAHCHAPAEGPPIGPPLAGRKLPPEAIQLIARNGVGSMPAFPAGAINDQELAALADFVSKLPATPNAEKPS